MITRGQQQDAVDNLRCPVCRSDVPPRSAACRSCHLPIRDVVANQRPGGSRSNRRVLTRLWGIPIYGGIFAWCLLQLPTAAVFVVPAVVAGFTLHVLRGRPYTGALVFLVIVVVAPALFWPSIATEAFDGLTSRL
ncbi:hypothetical protein [Nocardioides zeae]|uniref:Uncharacterized protein n=1 Tax=Nocardioides zeae TaxID=1457234 RepID=A0A6P0HMM6_9ACTN|nr:hypothetical protein [Nocardioides zeae]NEN79540.1 hypothetical protein [Nocardioides zeae]